VDALIPRGEGNQGVVVNSGSVVVDFEAGREVVPGLFRG
jgi:hypothetical protein